MPKKGSFHLILACILLTSFVSMAADPQADGPVAFLEENIYTFDPVIEGERILHEFVLHNRGKLPLDILNIHSG